MVDTQGTERRAPLPVSTDGVFRAQRGSSASQLVAPVHQVHCVQHLFSQPPRSSPNGPLKIVCPAGPHHGAPRGLGWLGDSGQCDVLRRLRHNVAGCKRYSWV